MCSGFLAYSFMLEISKKSISAEYNQKATRIVIGLLILMFVLPHLVHYGVDYYAKLKSYYLCEDASYQWFYDRELVFTTSPEVCAEVVADRLSH